MARKTQPVEKAIKAAAPVIGSGGPIRVRATRMGYYNNLRRREGDVFTLHDARLFSKNWMVVVPVATPERHTRANEALKREHDEVLAETLGKGAAVQAQRPADPDNIIGE